MSSQAPRSSSSESSSSSGSSSKGLDGDDHMTDISYVFKPPAKILVDLGDELVYMDRDATKHYIPQPPTEEGDFLMYLVSSEDRVLSRIQVSEDGRVFFKGHHVPEVDRACLNSFSALKNVCLAADRAAKATQEKSADWLAHGQQVSKPSPKDDMKMFAKVKEPRCFDGAGKDPAADLSIWLWEVKDYLSITNVPEASKATFACTFLSGQARSGYVIRRTYAAESEPDFVHNMAFFEKTLKTMYVPASQGSNLYKRLFTGDGWLMQFNHEWTVNGAITKYESMLALAQAHGLVVEPIAKVQIFVTRLPPPVYEPLKLNRENQPQRDWSSFKEHANRLADELQMKYLDWLRSPSGTNSANNNAKRFKSDSRPPTALAQSLAARVAAVSTAAGPSRSGDAKCGICNMTEHVTKECPFMDTTANYKREGFSKEVQDKVRANPKQYLADGKPNNHFNTMGGKTCKVFRKTATKRKHTDNK